MNSIEDIKHTLYINLSSRPDRKQHVESQLQMLGIKGERFNAIKLPNGALGCSMSHLKCLENAKKEGWSHLLIVEDDIKFLKPVEPYKGKGITSSDQFVLRKEGKKK